MNKFSKISKEQFELDASNIFGENVNINDIDCNWDSIKIPERSTSCSAGYDICSPCCFTITAGEKITIPTGIHIELDNDKFLAIVPRSGLGFKYGLRLVNTIGIIDADYFHADNEGHIIIKFIADKDIIINTGDRIAQGIIMNYCKTEDDNATETRTGGFGSTGK